MLNIVFLEPEIPYNTGNVGRTCVLTSSRLHLIRPMGFRINEKEIKKAGLDYWEKIDLTIHDSYKDFLKNENPRNIYFATTKAKNNYSDIKYNDGDYIIFGKESAGIPEYILEENYNNTIKIPMVKSMGRSLNLSNSVNIILYEALRQNGFFDLE